MRELHDLRITGLHLNESSDTLTVSLTDAEGQRGADLVLVNIVDLYGRLLSTEHHPRRIRFP